MPHDNSTLTIYFTESSLSLLCDSLHEEKAFAIGDSFVPRSHCVQVISLLFHSKLMFFTEYKRVNFVFELCMKKSSIGFDLLQTQSLPFPLSLTFNVLSR